MAENDIQSIINDIERISEKKNYWFVRTQSGDYYDDFLKGNYIALGYNEVSLYSISQTRNKDGIIDEDKLIQFILSAYPNEERPRYIATQLVDFVYNIKKGDIVIIPDVASEKLSFGEVSNSTAFIPRLRDNCPFIKRKNVKYLKKDVPFRNIDPKISWLKYTQRTITRIDDGSASIVDRILNTLYIKNNQAHLALNLRATKPINAVNLFETWLDIFNLAEEFGISEGIEVKNGDFDIRINLQSPGDLELINTSIQTVVLVCVVLTALIGAEFEYEFKDTKLKFKSEGLIKKFSDFLDKRKDRQLKQKLIDKIDQLEINREDVTSLLKQIQDREKGKKG
jgi:restriction system protein